MYVRRRGTLVEVETPAKVNLFLEVLSRRADGFHEIETLMVPIGLYDRVSLAANSTGTLGLTCRWAHGVEGYRTRHGLDGTGVWEAIPANEDNLALRSLTLLRRLSGVQAGADVTLVKRIPAAAGLGGASSDAAAVLAAANIAWRLGWSRKQLAEVAAELGSDVPFFLQDGACLCRGRGEQIEPVRGWKPLHLVVVRPPGGLATAAVYRACSPAAQPRRADGLVAAACGGDRGAGWPAAVQPSAGGGGTVVALDRTIARRVWAIGLPGASDERQRNELSGTLPPRRACARRGGATASSRVGGRFCGNHAPCRAERRLTIHRGGALRIRCGLTHRRRAPQGTFETASTMIEETLYGHHRGSRETHGRLGRPAAGVLFRHL